MSKIKFRDPFDDTPLTPEQMTPAGQGFDFEFGYDETGALVKIGKIDTDALIQSHLEECDLGYLLARFVNGDQSALSQRIGQYIDTTEMPTSLVEAHEKQVAAETAWASLTDDQKALLQDGKIDDFVKSFVPVQDKEVKDE